MGLEGIFFFGVFIFISGKNILAVENLTISKDLKKYI